MELGKEIPKKDFSKWIAALRSGEYTQTTGTLQDDAGYCCLGVACSVLPFKKRMYDGCIDGDIPSMQFNAPKWLKCVNNDFFQITESYISECNDQMAMSFDEIADILELVYVHKALE